MLTACDRVIANLDLPYSWAANPNPRKLELYSMTAEEFTNAKMSYDALVTTVIDFAIAFMYLCCAV